MQTAEIIETFEDVNPAYQVCMITGVRGSGKTVMLTEITKKIRSDDDWIVMDLSPERDLLQSFAANLSNDPNLSEIFQQGKDQPVFFRTRCGDRRCITYHRYKCRCNEDA